MSLRVRLATAAVVCLPLPLGAQSTPDDRPPVIDVHVHAPMGPGPVDDIASRLESRLQVMDSLNVRFAVLTGVPDVLFAWHRDIGDRLAVLPALLFPARTG